MKKQRVLHIVSVSSTGTPQGVLCAASTREVKKLLHPLLLSKTKRAPYKERQKRG
ncbi:expressed unknown protein [Ectocarpus siliculosus]|uniref:Uncharacterized protein n=1 Tax=Ectocarpus siliculosus TaxID=2880 RepID=D8LII0_ECTSI|nr:expressed unknown protein [Ectocarpus siliculosus]|eukprot:CBN80019.1 expressed unknown protein [Ectocarpus siliculosus]